MTVVYSTPFQPKPDAGFRLEDARTVWDAIVNLSGISTANGLTAIGTTRATALPLTAVLNEIDTAAASTGVNLPLSTGTRSTPYSFCVVINNGANAITTYGAQTGSDTINGVSGTTGVSQPAGSYVIYASAKNGAWFQIGAGGAASFTTVSASGSAAGGFLDSVTAGSTAANISNNGLTAFGDTVAATFTLAPPVAGCFKFLHNNSASSGAQTVGTGSSLITFGTSSSSLINLSFNSSASNDQVAQLHGESATKWVIVSLSSTNITVTT